jgi:hypothetical protein
VIGGARYVLSEADAVRVRAIMAARPPPPSRWRCWFRWIRRLLAAMRRR